VLCGVSLSANLWLALAHYHGLAAFDFLGKAGRYVAAEPLALVHHSDLDFVEQTSASYWHGADSSAFTESPEQQWRALAASAQYLELRQYGGVPLPKRDIPFIFDRPGAPNLAAFAAQEKLDQVIRGSADEYGAMLKLASWVGRIFDHGTDALPAGATPNDVARIVEAGKGGARYWCEIAARVMTHAAAAVGWPSRLVTISHDGYEWSHAVTEVWSKQFAKWFLIDTDFNVIYVDNGVPMSVFEIVARNSSGDLAGIIVQPIAPIKPFFIKRNGMRHLAPAVFRYAHLDLRNDWINRELPRGSPASGDLATWRIDNGRLGRLLSAIPQMQDEEVFNWPVNGVAVLPQRLQRSGDIVNAAVELRTYSPYFSHFVWSRDGVNWNRVVGHAVDISLGTGVHDLNFSAVTTNGRRGMPTTISLAVRVGLSPK